MDKTIRRELAKFEGTVTPAAPSSVGAYAGRIRSDTKVLAAEQERPDGTVDEDPGARIQSELQKHVPRVETDAAEERREGTAGIQTEAIHRGGIPRPKSAD